MRPPLESGFDDPTLPGPPEGQRAPCPEAGNDGDALACPPSGGEQPKPAQPDDPVEWVRNRWEVDMLGDVRNKYLRADNAIILAERCREAETNVGNLLARIHRDGGHYQGEFGTLKALCDADMVVARLHAESDGLRAQLSAAQARVAELEAQNEEHNRIVREIFGEITK